jgi:hypothetical protein
MNVDVVGASSPGRFGRRRARGTRGSRRRRRELEP